ncbi:hypothetical protein GVAV_002762 [Gurleya vavrai]
MHLGTVLNKDLEENAIENFTDDNTKDSETNIIDNEKTNLLDLKEKKENDNAEIANTMQNIAVGKKEEEENVEMRINRIKDEIKNEENTNKFNLETKHGIKEKIHILFRRLTLNKLEMTEKLLFKMEEHSKKREEIDKNRVMTENDVKILFQKKESKINF